MESVDIEVKVDGGAYNFITNQPVGGPGVFVYDWGDGSSGHEYQFNLVPVGSGVFTSFETNAVFT
jgi:hypothetical protein